MKQCIFTCQQLLILEQYRVNLVIHTYLTLTDLYCYFEALVGKILIFYVVLFQTKKQVFRFMGFCMSNWGSDFQGSILGKPEPQISVLGIGICRFWGLFCEP